MIYFLKAKLPLLKKFFQFSHMLKKKKIRLVIRGIFDCRWGPYPPKLFVTVLSDTSNNCLKFRPVSLLSITLN